MSGQTFENQFAVRAAIQEYLEKNGMTSLRKIAKHVAKKTGIEMPASSISRLVRKFGYDRPRVTWEKKKS